MKNLKKQTKAIVCLLLVALLTLALVSCGASQPKAEDAEGSHGELSWKYTKEDSTLRISGSGEMKDFENADDVAWAAVRGSAEKVIVGDGITSVGDYAFYGMSALTDVTLPDTLTILGDYAFGYSSALKSVTVPVGVTSLGEGAFEACGALQSIYLPASVTVIGDRAFAYCYSMQSAMITGLPEEIGSQTFKNCRALERLTLRTALSEDAIAEDAFEGAKMGFADATKTDSEDGSSVITVHYVNKAGEAVAEDLVKTVAYGESYVYISPDVENHTADKLTVSGTADGINEEITVTYTENKTEEEADSESESDAEKEDEPVGAGTIIAIVVMALVLIGIAVGAFLLIRSDKKTAGKNTTTVRKDQNAKNQKNKKK